MRRRPCFKCRAAVLLLLEWNVLWFLVQLHRDVSVDWRTLNKTNDERYFNVTNFQILLERWKLLISQRQPVWQIVNLSWSLRPRLCFEWWERVLFVCSPATCFIRCSAGVGRTGTFIVVDRILQQIQRDSAIDVFGTVLEMRDYRCNMIQTEVWNKFAFRYHSDSKIFRLVVVNSLSCSAKLFCFFFSNLVY